MATMNFSIPDDVKEAFNKAFEGENKSAVITRLMRRAIEEKERNRRSRDWSSAAEIRARSRPVTDDEIRRAGGAGNEAEGKSAASEPGRRRCWMR